MHVKKIDLKNISIFPDLMNLLTTSALSWSTWLSRGKYFVSYAMKYKVLAMLNYAFGGNLDHSLHPLSKHILRVNIESQYRLE